MIPDPSTKVERVGGKAYFPGLDGLRAYAAMSVVVFHIGLSATVFGRPRLEFLPVFLDGPDAVTFFFVLSGFLITYLLLQEKEQTGAISLRRFYTRRAARIFPLYYMILGLGLWILPAIVPDYPKSLLSGGQIAMMATFLSNLAFALGAPLGSLSHLWSIGSEEQFYLLWPLLLRWVRRTWVAILAVAALWLVAMGAILLIIGRLEPTPVMKTAFRYIHFIRFECMAMGAAAALVLQRGHRLRTALLDLRTLIVACGIGLLTLIFWPLTTLAAVGFRELPLSFAFAVIVAQVADGRGRRLFELAPFRFLGQISYGLYMYHPLVIAIAAPRFFQGTSAAQAPFAFPWPYVLTVIAATISVATVSYGLIERPILGRAGSSRWLIDMKAGATSQESYPAKVQP